MRNREVRKPVSVVPGSGTDYDVNLPAGHYWLSMLIKSAVTGTTTTITLTPYVDKAGTQINNLGFRFYEADDATPVSAIVLPAGAAGRAVMVTSSTPTAEGEVAPVYCAGKLRVSVAVGTAVAGETLEILLVATRVG